MSLEATIKSTTEGNKAWHQERVIFETTELLCEIMDREKISRSKLAAAMANSKGYITQLLDGTTNMTLRTASDAFLAMGYEFHPSAKKIQDKPAETQHNLGESTIASGMVQLELITTTTISPTAQQQVSTNAGSFIAS